MALAALRGRTGRRGGGTVAERDHDREVMRDDVVHLAGDAGAFGGRGEFLLLIALTFQSFGAIVQFLQVRAAGGGVQAQAQSGGDHARAEDRDVPPVAARQAYHGGDDAALQQASRRQGAAPGLVCRDRVQRDHQGEADDQVDVPAVPPPPRRRRASRKPRSARSGARRAARSAPPARGPPAASAVTCSWARSGSENSATSTATSTSNIHQRTERAGGCPNSGNAFTASIVSPDQASARRSRQAAKPISTAA